jgi:hypothetical protein
MAVVQEPDFGAARDLFALYCKAKGLSARYPVPARRWDR